MKVNKLMLLLAAITVGFASALAQNTTSPYSMYGYGLLNDRATSMQRQMGGIGYALNSGRQINAMNPASYSAIDSLTFLWDMGVDVSMLWQKEGAKRDHSVGGGLDYLAMQFPLSRHIGMSIGLIPYSSVGYAFGNQIKHGTSENKGSGGINEAYAGISGSLFGFSLGANVAYSFGTITNDVYSKPGTSGNTIFEHQMKIRDWNVTIGAQYTLKLDRYNKVVVGVTYNPKKSLHGKSYATTQDALTQTSPDTIGTLKLSGNYYQPNTVGAGINFTRERSYRLLVELDYTWQQWSKAKFSPMYSPDGRLLFSGLDFNDRSKFALGAEFVPRVRGNYGQRIAFRAGAYYTKDYLRIQGNNVKEYGVSFGVGLPTPEGKTLVNIGLEYKHRSSSPVNLLSENYFNITLGVNFNEVWFWKRKIN